MASYIPFKVSVNMHKKRLRSFEKILLELENSFRTIEILLKDEINYLNDNCIIPQDYWLQSNLIAKYIINRRASNLTEAINLYEYEKHNDMLTEIQNEIKGLQESNNEILYKSNKAINYIDKFL